MSRKLTEEERFDTAAKTGWILARLHEQGAPFVDELEWCFDNLLGYIDYLEGELDAHAPTEG